jgi:hypothetical protein
MTFGLFFPKDLNRNRNADDAEKSDMSVYSLAIKFFRVIRVPILVSSKNGIQKTTYNVDS